MKKWLIAASALVLAGLIIAGGAIMATQGDFLNLSTVKYETNTYEISEAYQSISVTTDTADVIFEASEDGKTTVIAREEKNANHRVWVQDGVLTVVLEDNRQWYEHIGIGFGTTKITVQLPRAQYADLFVRGRTGDVNVPEGFAFDVVSISLSTGDISVSGISSGMLELSVSTGSVTATGIDCSTDVNVALTTGDAELTDITCKNLISKGTTGDLVLRNVIVQGCIDVQRDTGDVMLKGCDAAELSLTSTTGDVGGSLLSQKIFLTETATGSVRVPQSTTGGKCEVKTTTGDIKLEILP